MTNYNQTEEIVNLHDELVNKNIIHEFDKNIVIKNLYGCYGFIARLYYKKIIDDIVGNRILDAGCGFGLFSRLALDLGFDVHSIDIDDHSLEIAKNIFNVDCHNASIYETNLPARSRDVVVLMDTIQHLEFPRLLKEIERVGVTQVIVSESNNINPLLILYRKIVGHSEAHDYKIKDIVNFFSSYGFNLYKIRRENFIALPISGGLQRNPVPLLSRYPNIIYSIDRCIESISRFFLLDRIFAFRYILFFKKNL